jgi:sulfur-oxidizing protein SoxY
LPEVAENGNLVPFTVAVDYEMSDTDYIQSLHVIATANPAPPVISFYFTPLSGVARASSRMRLADSQDIVALAQTSGGEFFIGRRRVEIVVPCCGG